MEIYDTSSTIFQLPI